MKRSKLILILIMVTAVILVLLNFEKTASVISGGIIEGKNDPFIRQDMPLAVDEHYLYAHEVPTAKIVKYDKYDNFKKVSDKNIEDYVKDNIRDIAVDDKFLYVISWDGTLGVYDKTNLENLVILKAHSSWVMAIYLEDDIFYTGSWDTSVKIWNKTDFQLMHTFNQTCQVNSIVADENKIYVACETPHLLIIDKNSNELSTTPVPYITDKNGAVEFLDVDDKYLYSTCGDGLLKVWDKKNLNLIKELFCSDSPAFSVKSDREMTYCSGSGEVYFFDKQNFIPVKVKLPFYEQIHNMAFDEKNLYLGSMQNKIFIVDKDTKQVKQFLGIN